ncbi:hypothetical protein IQ249_17030 [Lusitaniella coriacea LEGE 07157]|uniref:Uncharacterized protein n=1 Tax=Lusitaniella coriacea LEGE 07157 TaxID=945747 RepID=A0A8J7J4M4_9CYAN|nr:hypothetical protein [Lusitaniella coriacea]MBE9117604.1 hypothetical protein [Lusitaniella coriacea LEGE 07157]
MPSSLHFATPPIAASMNQPQEYEAYIELAIDVFKTRDRKAIAFLKNFLYVLPSPSAIETVLIVALYRLAEIEPDTCRSILRHPDWFMPELDLRLFVLRLTLSQLKHKGFVPEQDFQITNQGLWLSHRAKETLWNENIPSTCLLIEEVLHISK